MCVLIQLTSNLLLLLYFIWTCFQVVVVVVVFFESLCSPRKSWNVFGHSSFFLSRSLPWAHISRSVVLIHFHTCTGATPRNWAEMWLLTAVIAACLACASALLLVQTAARRYSASVKLAVYFIFLICFKWLLKFEGRPSGWMGNKYSYRQSKESRSVFVEQKKNWQIRMSIEDEKFAPTNNKYKN